LILPSVLIGWCALTCTILLTFPTTHLLVRQNHR
jgi:hypothetical protein